MKCSTGGARSGVGCVGTEDVRFRPEDVRGTDGSCKGHAMSQIC